jgi:iron complex transport system substrate-binding protein
VAEFAKTFPIKISADKEKIIALGPDLVFVADWKEKEFVQALRDAKVPVFVFKAPGNFEELKLTIRQLATLVGEKTKGEALISSIDTRLASVQKKLSGVPIAKRPSILSYTFYGSTYGIGTSFDALVQKAGLINVASKAGMSGWPQVSKEQIIALDPDIIALPSWSYDGSQDAQKYLAAFMADPVFASLKAVKNKRVYILQDKHLQATSQYMVNGVEDLAKAAFPDLFRP